MKIPNENRLNLAVKIRREFILGRETCGTFNKKNGRNAENRVKQNISDEKTREIRSPPITAHFISTLKPLMNVITISIQFEMHYN